MFIIPDDYMDTRTCADCHKYLTVGPVKKYPSGEIKCGRCTKPNDGGRVQELVFPEDGMFKCVNRFEGCRRLLIYGQVADHESTCRSTTLECFCCRDAMSFPLYAFPKHFQARHEQSILKKASFSVRVTTPSHRVFLYRLKDNLFFVECTVHPKRSVELKTFFLGRAPVRPLYRYTVVFGDAPCKIETYPQPCLIHSKSGSEGFAFRAPVATVRYAFVQVHLDLRETEVHLAKNALVSPKSRVSLPRTLRFSDANCSRLSISPSLTSLILEDLKYADYGDSPGAYSVMEHFSEYIMYCFSCWTTTSHECAVFIETGALTYQVLCETCCDYFQRQSPDIAMLMGNELFPELKGANFEYSCVWRVWGCSQYFGQEERDDHEANCPLQPPRQCPVAGCPFRGRLPDIKAHFDVRHPTRTVVLSKVPLMFDRCPNTTRNSFYMWAYYDFVWIEVSPYDDDEFQIRLPRRKKLESFGQPQPRVMVTEIHTDEATLLFDDSSVIIQNGTVVHVWCFFPEDD